MDVSRIFVSWLISENPYFPKGLTGFFVIFTAKADYFRVHFSPFLGLYLGARDFAPSALSN
jgi:hypothetical protein